jgi:hypothetical protein
MRGLYTLLLLAVTTVGCAANVEEPVEQIPDPAPQQAPPAAPFGAEVRFIDPVMQALIEEAKNGIVEVPGREKPYYKPLENCPTCRTR